jgi:serine/threonine protein kinase
MLPTGTRLGRYEVLTALGEGGLCEVYRAKDERLGRDVAIKILPSSFSTDPDRLRRFEQEARATGALNHANVIVVHDTGQHDGAPYVVYELLEGTTLRALLTGYRRLARSGWEPISPPAWPRRTIAGSSTATSNRRTCSSRAKDA